MKREFAICCNSDVPFLKMPYINIIHISNSVCSAPPKLAALQLPHGSTTPGHLHLQRQSHGLRPLHAAAAGADGAVEANLIHFESFCTWAPLVAARAMTGHGIEGGYVSVIARVEYGRRELKINPNGNGRG